MLSRLVLWLDKKWQRRVRQARAAQREQMRRALRDRELGLWTYSDDAFDEAVERDMQIARGLRQLSMPEIEQRVREEVGQA